MRQPLSRICKAESSSSSILENLDECLKRHVKSGKHSDPSTGKDLHELTKELRKLMSLKKKRDTLIIISVTSSVTDWTNWMHQS